MTLEKMNKEREIMTFIRLDIERELEVISKILNKQTHKLTALNSRMDFIENDRNYSEKDETLKALQEMLDEATVIIHCLSERQGFLQSMHKCSNKAEE